MLELFIVFLIAGAFSVTPLLFHEMGHWVVLRRHNVPVVEHWLGLGPALLKMGRFRIGMLPIGGGVVPDKDLYEKLPPLTRMWVALAGPIASIIYGGIAFGLWHFNQELNGAHAILVVAELNFLLAAVNLIPIPPLDGFQAWACWKEHKGEPLSGSVQHLARRFGNGLVYGVGFLVLGLVFLK